VGVAQNGAGAAPRGLIKVEVDERKST
jgi:hypothetical protein